jgi:hypothetical protein
MASVAERRLRPSELKGEILRVRTSHEPAATPTDSAKIPKTA